MSSDRQLLTLPEAADLCRAELVPSGNITVRTLRTERDNGRLAVHKIGGRIYTTRRDLELMIERARCPDPEKAPASISEPAEAAPQNTLSSTERAKSAQAAARTALRKLKQRSPTISPANTSRRPALAKA